MMKTKAQVMPLVLSALIASSGLMSFNAFADNHTAPAATEEKCNCSDCDNCKDGKKCADGKCTMKSHGHEAHDSKGKGHKKKGAH